MTDLPYSKHVNKERLKKVSDEVMSKLNKREKVQVINLLEEFGRYKTKDITYTEMDTTILFTPNKIKESAYTIQEAMYDGRFSIRLEFEVVQDKSKIARKIHG